MQSGVLVDGHLVAGFQVPFQDVALHLKLVRFRILKSRSAVMLQKRDDTFWFCNINSPPVWLDLLKEDERAYFAKPGEYVSVRPQIPKRSLQTDSKFGLDDNRSPMGSGKLLHDHRVLPSSMTRSRQASSSNVALSSGGAGRSNGSLSCGWRNP